jgi:hypothetical protein
VDQSSVLAQASDWCCAADMNQPHVSAAADDVQPVGGEYCTGLWNHHDLGTCEVRLANAPESVLDRLQAMHQGCT